MQTNNHQFKKILVMCPGGAVTGGPEAMHYLVHVLRGLDLDAYIVYLPLGGNHEVPLPYARFNTPVSQYEDKEGTLIVFPEVNPTMALSVTHAKAAIWWLSLDNFLERRHISPLRDKIRYLKRVIKGQRPLAGVKALKNLIHFSQSDYSGKYLESKGLKVVPFYEPINEQFLTDGINPGFSGRVDEILYNPVKGKKVTELLMRAFPEIKFTALKGFNRIQLSEKLSTAKLYIDFGHHPGRDRMPREAAMHGCCVITGKLGAAQNNIDLPIQPKYKLDSSKSDFVEQFGLLVKDVFNDFPKHYLAFDHYRSLIKGEPQRFREQLKQYFK
ncbi:hypothetical protein ICV01_01740 [Polynucleobacter sp. MWH-Spelu-300-X4]|uniref:hypothetical protein n=1 Tax=Polynucleobacter sp. MWH-Spelu-300-X4 TaxID=2689109 RepID=UPI001BFCF31B|nr:hypothetical protein [Polynucleobacter sp. MWH-Spelu-300-X4]QWD80066.1 hypothetical protein ICV01_01740 [Polynucleobacter sp. MWH-Spelu-300-X4]